MLQKVLDTLGWHKLNYSVERSVGMWLSNIDTMGRSRTPMTGHYIAPLDTPLRLDTIYSSLNSPPSMVLTLARQKKVNQNNWQQKQRMLLVQRNFDNIK